LWFAQNILELTETSLDITIGKASKKYSNLHKSWLHMYQAWMNLEVKGEHIPVDNNIIDVLDCD